MNETWRPKIERWKPAIEDYLDLWDMSGADIDATLVRCQVDPVLRANTCGWKLRWVARAGIG